MISGSLNPYGRSKELSKHGRMVNKLQKELIKLLGRDCRKCGHRSKLEFAHVRKTKLCGKTGRGKQARMYDVKNHLDCYILLCKPCHRQFDKTHKFEHPMPILKPRYRIKATTNTRGLMYDRNMV